VPKYPREKGKPIDLPVYGDAEHNMRIYQAIGVLVINWGSDESVFLAMLQALLAGDKSSATIVWASFHNTSKPARIGAPFNEAARCRQSASGRRRKHHY